MHSCPRCGMDCDCSGDIDDVAVMDEEWVTKNCECKCEIMNEDERFCDDEYDDRDYYDYEYD